jgi:hypothetical protein
LLLFAVLLVINAFVTGALSGPFARYQARLAWLAPLAALLVLPPAAASVRHRKGVGGPSSGV